MNDVLEDVYAQVTTHCICETEEGEVSEVCFGCYEESVSDLHDNFLLEWQERLGNEVTNTIRITGHGMGWTRASGSAVIEQDELLKALQLNGEYTLRFHLRGNALEVLRTSHDEPTGAHFEVEYVPDDTEE